MSLCLGGPLLRQNLRPLQLVLRLKAALLRDLAMKSAMMMIAPVVSAMHPYSISGPGLSLGCADVDASSRRVR